MPAGGEDELSVRYRILIAGLGLMLAAAARADTAAEPPHISRPRPVPPTAANVLPLPPAEMDNTPAIGGKDVKAREIDTRLRVDVAANGRGRRAFVLASG